MTHSFQVGDSVYIIYIKAPTRFTSNYYSTRNKLRIKGIITGTTNGWLKVTIDYLELCKISSKKKKWIEEKNVYCPWTGVSKRNNTLFLKGAYF